MYYFILYYIHQRRPSSFFRGNALFQSFFAILWARTGQGSPHTNRFKAPEGKWRIFWHIKKPFCTFSVQNGGVHIHHIFTILSPAAPTDHLLCNRERHLPDLPSSCRPGPGTRTPAPTSLLRSWRKADRRGCRPALWCVPAQNQAFPKRY